MLYAHNLCNRVLQSWSRGSHRGRLSLLSFALLDNFHSTFIVSRVRGYLTLTLFIVNSFNFYILGFGYYRVVLNPMVRTLTLEASIWEIDTMDFFDAELCPPLGYTQIP